MTAQIPLQSVAHPPELPAMRFEARKTAVRQSAQGDLHVVLAIHPDEIPPQLIRSRPNTRYVVALVEINDDDIPVDRLSADDRRRARLRSIMRMKDPVFWDFMVAESGDRARTLMATTDVNDATCVEELVKILVLEHLRIPSRKEIEKDPGVAMRWIELERRFLNFISIRKTIDIMEAARVK